jgi:hypothetical protein
LKAVAESLAWCEGRLFSRGEENQGQQEGAILNMSKS